MQALQAQMNPHFIFNALNAIQHYLTVGEREQSVIYLAKFAKLIRTIFEYSKKSTISLTQEIEFLELYVQLEKLRFKDKVSVNFKVEEHIYTDEINLPPLLIQPLIENAFKHGFLHKVGKGHLEVLFYTEDNLLKCRITDDGVGREKTKTLRNWKSKIHQSSGLKTIEERLNIWHRKIEADSDEPVFQITDLKNNDLAAGTQIHLILNTYFDED